jgi:hypothetical protein
MTRFNISFSILFIAISLSSCFKEDESIIPHQPGLVETDTIPMSYNYKFQVYFDLDSGVIVSQNLKTDSDLGFECGPGGWKIILNTSDFMKAADLGIVPFGQAQDTTHATWKFDKSDGNPDSLAIGTWYKVLNGDTVSNNHVYAIDRGFDENANSLGLYQVIFDSLAMGRYYFRYAPIDGGSIYSGVVTKDETVNYMFYSFSSGGSVKRIEPSKDNYDLLFTQYSTLLYTDIGEPYPYLVTGVLLNRNNVQVAIDTIHDFSSITLAESLQLPFSGSLDAIGYEWKSYDFETGAYTVNSKKIFIITNNSGLYFKLRFVGFYSNTGEKGYPVIEHQVL